MAFYYHWKMTGIQICVWANHENHFFSWEYPTPYTTIIFNIFFYNDPQN